ncbi:MAG TPA: TolC family protein, partial [Magnetospirillum sp.]|nr:TolC family protein [Magnetospirillum sp.]
MHARSVGCIAAALMAVGMADCRAETLVEALAAAYGSNSNLAAARARLRAADEGVSQAVATWRPTVTITGGAGRQMVTSPANAALFGYHSYMSNQSATYSLVQPLYQGGLTTASVEQAENSVRAQRANLRATEATVLLTAATAFFDVVRDRAILKVNIENEQNLREQAAASHERFREAEISSTSVAQSEARLSQASAQRALAETALADSQANFAAVIGHFPEALEVPTEADAFPQTLDTVKAAALAENPNLVAARYAYD